MRPSSELIPTRQSLLSRIQNWDDNDSWRDFCQTYWPLIYSATREAGLNDAEAQDVAQETLITVAKKIPDFKYDPARGSFKGWLLRITSWRIRDCLRKRRREREHLGGRAGQDNSTQTEEIERVPDPVRTRLESVWDKEWEENLLRAAIDRAKRKSNIRDLQIFDLHVTKEWPVSRVTRALSINRGRVYLAKYRVARLIKREMESMMQRPLRLQGDARRDRRPSST